MSSAEIDDFASRELLGREGEEGVGVGGTRADLGDACRQEALVLSGEDELGGQAITALEGRHDTCHVALVLWGEDD